MIQKNKIKFFILLTLMLLLCWTLAITIGPADLSFIEVIKILTSTIPGLSSFIPLEGIEESKITIVLKIRLPRIVLATLVGMALASVGTSFQGLFKNPMADPYIIGISSGAALGAAFAIVMHLPNIIGQYAIPLSAFIVSLLSIFIVYNIAREGHKVTIYNLLLSGVALGSFLSALMSLLMVINSREMSQIVYWLLGSFSMKNWSHVQIAAPLIILGIISLNFFNRELNVMLFGDDTAHNLGIDIEKTKKYILVFSSLIVATAVSVSGTIGFVGLIIPHTVRLITGPDHRILMPVSAIIGGIFLVMADTLARTILNGTEIPIGIVTALFGGPFFIYLLKRKNS